MSGRKAAKLAAKEEKRKLVQEKESARLARFEAQCAALKEQGYAQKDCTLKILSANIWGICTAIPFAVAGVAVYAVFAQKRFLMTGNVLYDLLLFVLCLIVAIPAHEGLHALCWAAVNNSFSGIRLGFDSRTLTPFCACEKPMKRGKYLIGCLAPFVFLGVVPCIVGVFSGYLFAVAVGAVNILSAGGDLLVFFKTFACRSGSVFIDHPSACGFYAFGPKKSSKTEK